MQLSKNFSLAEMIASGTAKRMNIDNTPNEEVLGNLTKLAEEVLQPIRDAWGAPVVVSSAYRCPKLNKAVGGVTNSDHKFGCAADIHTLSDKVVDNKKLFDLIVKMAGDDKISCRQIIDEYGYNWIHVSINNKYNSKKKNQIVHIK